MKRCLLFVVLFFSLHSFAQEDFFNLEFENEGNSNKIFPWYKTFFSKREYRIDTDSQMVYSGKYSLRFTYDTVSKDISEGQVVNNVPIDVYGKKLKVSGFARQSNPGDTAGGLYFIISADKGEKKIANKGSKVTGAAEWKPYNFEFDLDTFNKQLHHLRITVGAYTKDTFWIDNFKIEVDGRDLYSIPPFSSAKGEVIQKISGQQLHGLKMLGYIWGFLKYYHPNVATGKYDWDRELFRIIPLVKNSTSNEQLNRVLSTWIDSLGAVTKCRKCDASPGKNSFTGNIDLKWMNDSSFSVELKNKLKYILDNRHQGNGYYAKYEPVQNLLFSNENEYDWREKVYPNEKFRLHFLFRYWNTIQYFFPYKYVIGKDWNQVLEEFIPQFAEAGDSVAYHIAMNKLVNSVNDSHSGSYDLVLAKEFGHYFLPVTLKIIDDQAVVKGYYNDTLARVNDLQLGDIITMVDGKTIKQKIDKHIDLVNGSNYPRKLLSLQSMNFIAGGKDSLVNLTVIRDNKERSLVARRYIFSEFNYKPSRDTVKWKILEGNIGFVNMGILENKDIDVMMDAFRNTKSIIFDIRNYPRGTYPALCSYLNKGSMAFANITYPDLDFPGNFLWRKSTSWCAGGKSRWHYKGKTIILVNETTQSHAEWTTMALQSVEGAVTIGSQTSGADGNASILRLTGNYFTYMTGLGVFYPDNSPTQRVGVRIDIEVKPTAEGIRQGRDEVLDKAIQIAHQ